MRILALNAGSASHRAQLFAFGAPVPLEPPEPRWQAEVQSRTATFDDLLSQAPREQPPDAVAHRVVHGGLDPALGLDERIDDRLVRTIREAQEFAPEHNGLALEGIDAATRQFARTPQIAIFDHALGADAPEVARTFPVPAQWRDSLRIRRLGFHGISHRDSITRVQRLLGNAAARVVTIHLGSGCSLAAFDGPRMIDTTMGMTPMEGLMMGARSGSIDPGVIFYLLRHGHDAASVEKALNESSGLLGVSRLSLDTRDVLRAMDGGDSQARLAFDMYVYRIRTGIGAMAAALGGLDAVAWSGPVGEHMPRIRAAVVDGLGLFGLAVDPRANEEGTPDMDISTSAAPVRTFVIRTLEEWAMARRAARLLNAILE